MIVIIDRFEDEFAVVELENREMINMPRKLVPVDAQEGDLLEILISQEETKKRKDNIKNLIDELFE